jgi:hypothetical protein
MKTCRCSDAGVILTSASGLEEFFICSYLAVSAAPRLGAVTADAADLKGSAMARDVLAELANFTGSLEGWGLELQFDPDDPESVEQAIREMEMAIDAAADPYPGNEAVAQIAEQLKEQYRLGIREQRPVRRGSGEGEA